ncbi:MAG: glycoside hydrolase family 3 C-terminal domain-containing protein [Eubacteriales bacterium]
MSDIAKKIVSQLTLDEKADLCMGLDSWHLVSVERLGVGQVMVADGPHGLRKEDGSYERDEMNDSVPSTCFPTACATASSWNRDLMYEMGQAMADECLQEQVSVILGPGANIKRSPLCGRNFEYISEDPYHAGEMSAALVQGVQSKNIGTSLKHFAMNNQERLRFSIDAVVDERAQREIYLAGFEKCVKKAKPWTLMCAYNKVDGEFMSENKRLLTDVLRDEWGFEGLVMSDWGAVNKRDEGIKAGLDLEMPAAGKRGSITIKNAIAAGTLKMEELDKVVERVVDLILKSQEHIKKDYKYDVVKHHELAKKAAQESVVLLKNDDILPLEKNESIAVIGEFAKVPRYQGAGSSLIHPTKLDTICDVLDEKEYSYEYAKGYDANTKDIDKALIDEAIETAKKHKYAIIFAGLTDIYETEGMDRDILDIPESHSMLIEEVSKVNKNVILVLSNGSPISMPWIEKTKAVLESYLSGQAGAGAVVDILFGDVCPSAKLAETFPIALHDTPCYSYFPGYPKTVEYRESIYVGYRYYDKAKKDVLFPFGFGLSYTQFEYSDLKIEKKGEFEYKVVFSIKNTGKKDGAEIAQIYVKNNESPIFKAEKELRAFEKVFLKSGEKKEISIELDKRAFAYYNVNINDWHVDSGIYSILVGSSSQDIRLQEELEISAKDDIEVPDYRELLPCYYSLTDSTLDIDEKDFEKLLGRELPERYMQKGEKFTTTSTFEDLKDTLLGKLFKTIARIALKRMLPKGVKPEEHKQYIMMYNTAMELPFKSLGLMAGNGTPPYAPEAMEALANRKLIKAIKYILKKK